MLKKTLLHVMLLTLVSGTGFALSGCNTVAGAGKDVSAVGDGVHDAARDTQKKM